MNIAVYFDLPQGGASRTMEKLIELLGKNHNLTIFSGNDATITTQFRPLLDFYGLVIARRTQKKIAEEINKGDFDLVFVSHDRHLQSPWILRYLKKPTVFLCQEPTRSFFEKFLDIDENLPLVNKVYEKINRYFRKTAEIKNASYATKIISNSFYSSESIFRAYGISSTPIHLGVDTTIFKKDNSKKINQVVIVGNDEPQKDLCFAINSLALVDTKIRPLLAIACPRENNLSKIEKHAKSCKVKIKIMVGLTPPELSRVYSQSLATLATAHLEPFGLSVVESLACGTPVIAIREGGFRETVRNLVNGLLTSRNEKSFSLALEKILKDKNLRETLGANGPDSVESYFTWEKTVTKIEKVFHEVA